MFEVGFQEIVLIALLALIVLGPEKLPKLAAQLGRWTGRARSMARNLRQQLEQEVSYDDLLKQKQAAEEALRKANADIAASINPPPTPAQPVEAKAEPAPQPPAALPATGTQDAATDPAK
jgi:sec-independent protein translocase protein TatB